MGDEEKERIIMELFRSHKFLSEIDPKNKLLKYADITIAKIPEGRDVKIQFFYERFLDDCNVDKNDPLRDDEDFARVNYVDLIHDQLYAFSKGPLEREIMRNYDHLEELNSEHPLLLLAIPDDKNELKLREKQFQEYAEIAWWEFASPKSVYLRVRYLEQILAEIRTIYEH